MRKFYSIIILLFILSSNFETYAQFAWQRNYGDYGGDISNDFKTTSDSGYILLYRWIDTTIIHSEKIGVIKTNSNGDTIWSKRYTIPGMIPQYYPQTICETNDSAYIIGGYGLVEQWTVQNGSAGFLLKINLSGDTLWSKIFEGQGEDWFIKIIQGNDSSYIALARLQNDTCIVKLNISGDIVWQIDSLRINDLVAVDSGYLLMGSSYCPKPFIKIDEGGGIVYKKLMPFEGLNKVIKTSDNNLLIHTYHPGISNGLVKCTRNGDIIWSKDSITGIFYFRETLDKGIVGLMTYWGLWDSDFYISKYDSLGNFQKDTLLIRYGSDEYVKGLEIAPDGDYILYGYGENGPITGTNDIILAKFHQWIFTSIVLVDFSDTYLKIFPVPTIDNLTIYSLMPVHKFEIFNVYGKLLKSKTDLNITSVEVDVSMLSTGTYFIKIKSDKGTFTRKFIKL